MSDETIAEVGDAAAAADPPPVPERPLAGRPGWVITDGKAGMEVQCVGVAEALGLDYAIKRVAPRQPWRALAPWGPVGPSERFARAGSAFARPWPEVAVATGRLSIPYIRKLARAAGPETFTVVIQDPRTGPRTADLICVPVHDGLRGPNVITTLTPPHDFTPERLAGLRATPPAEITNLPSPRVAVALGGPNAIYDFAPEDAARLGQSLASLAALGTSFMITPSRRTPAHVIDAVSAATSEAPRLIWDGQGENPYAAFLALADLLVVTADSVNMTGEACATGRPVYVFEPQGGSAKFGRFHEALRRYGAARTLPETFRRLETWSYGPLDSAATIAREIERRWRMAHTASVT